MAEHPPVAHTPGPWRVLPGANSHLFEGRLMAGDTCIAFVDAERVGDDWDEANAVPSANAHLMTAGPDLLAAAIKAMDECCDLIATPAGDALEAAIAKATGVTQ